MQSDMASLTSRPPPPPAPVVQRAPPKPVVVRPAKPAVPVVPAPEPEAELPPPIFAPAATAVAAPVLTGYRELELRALLGPPASEEIRPPGKQWRYRFDECTLDIQLYPDVETKQYGTLSYKVKSDDDTDEGRRVCLAQLRSRLPPGR